MPEKPISNLNELNYSIDSLENRVRNNEDFGKKIYSSIVDLNNVKLKNLTEEIKNWKIITLFAVFFSIVNLCFLIFLIFSSMNGSKPIISAENLLQNNSSKIVGKWVRTQATSYPTLTPEKSPIPSATHVRIIISWRGTPDMTPQIVPSNTPQPPRECSLNSPEWFEFFTDGGFTTPGIGNYGTYSIDNGNRLKLVYNIHATVYDVEISGNEMILVSDKGCRTVYHK